MNNRESCMSMSKYKFEGKTILVIDDNESQLAALVMYFERYKANVLQADSAKKAIEIVNSVKRIDHVVCDFNLNGDNAFSVLDQIKVLAKKPNFFVMSGDLDLSSEACVAKGATALLKKPFNLSHLDALIEKALIDTDSFKRDKLSVFLKGRNEDTPFKVACTITMMDTDYLIVHSDPLTEDVDVVEVEIDYQREDGNGKVLILKVEKSESFLEKDDKMEIHFNMSEIPKEWQALIKLREKKQQEVNELMDTMKGVA